MKVTSIKEICTKALSPLALITGALLSGGCEHKQGQIKNHSSSESNSIIILEKRINKIENQIRKEFKTNYKEDNKEPLGPIKSITFRIGTEDDRLRIYWADGSNSDLPCTKEQSIWVCG